MWNTVPKRLRGLLSCTRRMRAVARNGATTRCLSFTTHVDVHSQCEKHAGMTLAWLYIVQAAALSIRQYEQGKRSVAPPVCFYSARRMTSANATYIQIE